jgi:hypothetical protein
MEDQDIDTTGWTEEELKELGTIKTDIGEIRETIMKALYPQTITEDPTTDDKTLEPTLFTAEPFRLIVGVTYVTACKQKMRVVTEEAGLFLGLVEGIDGNRAIPTWYERDGAVTRDFDANPEQDPYDVVRVFRAPDSVFLIKKNGYYTSNNCIMSRDNAVKIALERGGEIVEFLEVTET